MHGLSALRTPLEMRSMPKQKAPSATQRNRSARQLMLPLFVLTGTAVYRKVKRFIRIFSNKPEAWLCVLWTSCASSEVQKAPLPRGLPRLLVALIKKAVWEHIG